MKIPIKNYTFDASAKQIVFTDYANIDLDSVLIAINVADNIQIYNCFIVGKGGTVATNVLTLEFDTTSMNDTDELQIWYWDVAVNYPVDVENFPAEYPLPAAQLATLTPPAAISGFATELTLDELNTAIGAKADAEATDNTGTFSLIAFIKRLINTTLSFLQVRPKLLGVSASVTASGVAFTQDVSDYKSYSVQISGTFVATFNFQVSDDNVNWGSLPIRTPGNITTVSALASSSIGVYSGAIPTTKYFRVNLTSYTSGTVVITAEFSSLAHVPDVLVTMSELMVAGTSVAVNNGTASGSTPRVVIASDNSDISVKPKPQTSGGATPYVLISASGTNATSVKGSTGNVYGIQVYNTNAAARYLKLYNKATAPTVGTDTPLKVITIPGNTAGAGSNVPLTDIGVTWSLGIALALTTGAAHTDTGVVAANEIIVNLDYN